MKLIRFLKKVKRDLGIIYKLQCDVFRYKSYYTTSTYCEDNGYRMARDILVYSHILEKGMSHKQIKPLFGYERISAIANLLEVYIEKGGSDKYVIGTAISTLNKYNDINKKLGVAEDKLIPVPQIRLGKESVDVGVETVTEEQYFAKSNGTFSELCKARHSIRLYDCKSDLIEVEEIRECIKRAQCCPSACNRQAVRVKLIQDQKMIEEISEIQGGAAGFGANAGSLLIITVDVSLYEPYERRLPMLDAGIFIMNLTYALYESHLGSCVLNGSFTPEREEKMTKVVNVPKQEMYAAIIAVSKIPQNEEIRIAKSSKRNVEDIIEIINSSRSK